MSDIPTRENRAAEAKRLALTDKGMQRIGWIYVDPETNRRATLDYFGRVQWWEIDGSGRMHAQAQRIAELEAENERLHYALSSAACEIEDIAESDEDELIALADRMMAKLRPRMGLNREGEG